MGMKYVAEILVLIAFIVICMLVFNQGKRMRENEDYRHRIDSLQTWVSTISADIDSIQESEQITITNIKKIHHVYDSTAHVIYYLSDSTQNELLFANCKRYSYLLNEAAGKDN